VTLHLGNGCSMAAVRKGLASAPLGKPRPVADVPLTAP